MYIYITLFVHLKMNRAMSLPRITNLSGVFVFKDLSCFIQVQIALEVSIMSATSSNFYTSTNNVLEVFSEHKLSKLQ